MFGCMRTTLTLDDDVAANLEHFRREQDRSLKEIVNRALRLGLKQLTEKREKRVPFRTEPVSAGRCLVGDLVDVSEALAIAEGEDFR